MIIVHFLIETSGSQHFAAAIMLNACCSAWKRDWRNIMFIWYFVQHCILSHANNRHKMLKSIINQWRDAYWGRLRQRGSRTEHNQSCSQTERTTGWWSTSLHARAFYIKCETWAKRVCAGMSAAQCARMPVTWPFSILVKLYKHNISPISQHFLEWKLLRCCQFTFLTRSTVTSSLS